MISGNSSRGWRTSGEHRRNSGAAVGAGGLAVDDGGEAARGRWGVAPVWGDGLAGICVGSASKVLSGRGSWTATAAGGRGRQAASKRAAAAEVESSVIILGIFTFSHQPVPLAPMPTRAKATGQRRCGRMIPGMSPVSELHSKA